VLGLDLSPGMAAVAARLGPTAVAGHRAQVLAVLDAAVRRVTGRPAPSLEEADAAFDAAVGTALLPATFAEVTAHDLTTEIDVPDPAAVVGYLASFEPELSGLAGPVRPVLLAEIAALVGARIAARGAFRVTSRR
jgi:hypothetical protein